MSVKNNKVCCNRTISGELNDIAEGWYVTSGTRAVDCNKDEWI